MAATAVSPFLEGFSKSAVMILVSEIGDKTFFIAAIMAMRHSQLVVLTGALGALWVMTALSAAMGWAAPALISPALTHHAATALFFFFGLRTLYKAAFAWEASGELEEVEAELAAKEPPPTAPAGLASPGVRTRRTAAAEAAAAKAEPPARKARKAAAALLSPVLVEVFTLTFLAEWGDRSQVATIGLAASSHPLGVTLGGCLGHALCTSAAVLGGKSVAGMVSERAVALCGGALFVLFGAHSLVTGPDV